MYIKNLSSYELWWQGNLLQQKPGRTLKKKIIISSYVSFPMFPDLFILIIEYIYIT